MNVRAPFKTRLLWWIALAATVGIGSSWGYQLGEEGDVDGEIGTSGASRSDCSFQQAPGVFSDAGKRRMEVLSLVTERFARQNGSVSRSQADFEKHSGFLGGQLPSRGYIDDFIFGKLRQDGIPHASLSSDAEFLRRLRLDLTGRIPTSQEVHAFLQDRDPDKRRKLIAQILGWGDPQFGSETVEEDGFGTDGADDQDLDSGAESKDESALSSPSPAFVDKWTMFFGDLLRNTARDNNIRRFPEGRNAFHEFIREFLASGMPYDVFVKRLLTAGGNSFDVGEVNWVVGGRARMGPIQDTYDMLWVRAATQFLGMSHFDCLLCHAGAGHVDTLNLWSADIKREEAWEMAAFFSRTRFTRVNISQRPRKYSWTVTDRRRGDYRLNTDFGNRPLRLPVNGGDVVKPRYIFSEAQVEGRTYRESLVENLVGDRQFARATVNYLWREMMGMGIVEPADQFDLARLDPSVPLPEGWSLQPTHPELLEALADDFIHSGFSIRHILFQIADSNAYQLSSSFPGEWKETYVPYFARKFVRRLWAEEIHDAVSQSTGVVDAYRVEGFNEPVHWAMQFPDTAEPRRNRRVREFLDLFLRGDRDQNPRSDEASILQALNMMNHRFVVSRIQRFNANSTVSKLLGNDRLSDSDAVEELFLRTLSRFPTGKEMSFALTALQGNRARGLENLQWVLLNKLDFLYNY